MTSNGTSEKEQIIELAKAGVRPKILAKFFSMPREQVYDLISKARTQGHAIRNFMNGAGGVSEQAVLMYLDGMAVASISKALNCPTSTVYWAVKMARERGLPLDEASAGVSREDHVVVRIKGQNAFNISKEAKRRGMTPTDLANRVITAVLTDNLFDAVLDEDAPESTSQKGASHVH